MNQRIRGTYQNGQVLLDAPTNWPNGTNVRIEPILNNENDDSDETARLLALMDQIPPNDTSAADEAEWQKFRATQRVSEAQTFDARAEVLRRMWD